MGISAAELPFGSTTLLAQTLNVQLECEGCEGCELVYHAATAYNELYRSLT